MLLVYKIFTHQLIDRHESPFNPIAMFTHTKTPSAIQFSSTPLVGNSQLQYQYFNIESMTTANIMYITPLKYNDKSAHSRTIKNE